MYSAITLGQWTSHNLWTQSVHWMKALLAKTGFPWRVPGPQEKVAQRSPSIYLQNDEGGCLIIHCLKDFSKANQNQLPIQQ